MRYYIRRLPNGDPAVIFRSGPDGDSLLSIAHPDWAPDKGADLLGMLVKGEYSLDGLDAADVDTTVAAILARTPA